MVIQKTIEVQKILWYIFQERISQTRKYIY